MLRLAAVLLWLNVGQAGAELCLDDGVPGSQRKYIQAGCKGCNVMLFGGWPPKESLTKGCPIIAP